MATASLNRKSSRLDLRMTGEEKQQIEEAAALNGQSVSQWSLGRLLESARNDILAAHSVRMTNENFDTFVELLEAPPSPTFAAFATEKTIWEK